MKTTALGAAASLLLATLAQAATVRVDGHEIHYEVHGDPGSGGVPVLMLHGGMMTFASSFGAMTPELARDRPVIGVEQQGHGHTPLNSAPITLAAMRRDTLGVLDALSVEKAHVVGFSAGGMLGLELAVNATERVASLTVISAAARPGGFVPGIIRMQKEPGYQPPPEVLALMPGEEDFARMAAEIAEKNPGGAATVPETMQKLTAFITSDWGWPDEQIEETTVPVLVVNPLPVLPLHRMKNAAQARQAKP